MVKAGEALNVVTPVSEIFVNHRIHPSDTIDGVLAHDRKVLSHVNRKLKHPNKIAADVLTNGGWQGTAAAPIMSGPHYDIITGVTADVYGIASAPSLMIAATDTPHYLDLCDEVC